MYTYTSGSNLIPYKADQLLFYDFCKEQILSYQPSTNQTTVFEPQPSSVPKYSYFFNCCNSIPTLLHLIDTENDGYRFEKVSELKDGKWVNSKVEQPTDVEIRLCRYPIVAYHNDTIYAFCDHPWKTNADFFIAILKCGGGVGDGIYCKYVGKIDINFIKADVSWEKFDRPHLIVAGAVVVENNQLVMIYAGGCGQRGQSEASMDLVAIFDLDNPQAPPKKVQLKPEAQGKCRWGYEKNFPCFNFFNQPHFSVYGRDIWYSNLGEVAKLNIDSWAWESFDSFSYNKMCGAGLCSGSTLTDQGKLFIGWKYSVAKELTVKDYNLR